MFYEAANSILIFADNDKHKLIQDYKTDESTFRHKIYICQHSPLILVEWFNPSSDNCTLAIRKTVYCLKDHYLQWLLHLNDNFDDDLLLDCLKLLSLD